MISLLPADFTIVIPTYNERDRIDMLLRRLFETCDREGLAAEVVIVDDNSKDGTGAIAERWARHRRVRVIHRPGKLGLGTAVLEGFALAQTEIVGVMDGDLSPELLPTLFRTMSEGTFDSSWRAATCRAAARRTFQSADGCCPVRDAGSPGRSRRCATRCRDFS